jgi:hypothetical protein
MSFQKATKTKSKLRAALFGPSGAGKTYTALSMASGMGKKIALIDSERKTASKYADRFDFDAQDLTEKSIEEYCGFIAEAAAEGYDVLIIDSLSHAWQKLNEDVEKIADARYKGNYWAAWSEGTPMQRRLIDAIVSYPGHIIATMRSKTEWQTGGGEGNKSRPIRVGLAPEQGKGIEYEFDILFEITPEHLATIIKDRTGKFQDRIIEKPGKSFGEELVAWLNEGVVTVNMQITDTIREIGNIYKSKSEKNVPYFTDEELEDGRVKCRVSLNMTIEQRLEYLQSHLNEQKKILHKRISQEVVEPPKPVAQEQEKPIATTTTQPTTTAKPQSESGERSIKADFEKMVQDKNQPSENKTEESCETVDDGFEDDVPWEKHETADAQQEIF